MFETIKTWKTRAKELYAEGYSVAQIIQNDKGVNTLYYKKVSDYLKSQGVEIINFQNIPRGTDTEIIHLYSLGNSVEKISKMFKTADTRVSKVLKENGITIINKQNERGTNHDIFENIDSEEKAYWLGFLYADGHIHSETNQISLALQESDYKHLEKFKVFIGAENLISYQAKTKSFRYAVASVKMKKDLVSKGCLPKKSEILEFPSYEQVPKEYTIAFIRGYFDGDGSLSYSYTGKVYRPTARFLGTLSILVNINIALNMSDNTVANIANPNGSILIFESGYYGHNAVIVLKTLYANANIFLDRKYKRYQVFKENDFAVQDRNILKYERGISVKAE